MNNPWGELTGVKPVKLTRELFKGNPYNGRQPHEKDEVFRILTEERGLSREKAGLIIEIYEYQQQVLKGEDYTSCGLYIGIPFCPTRCLYCSFTSNPIGLWADRVDLYLECLKREMLPQTARMRRNRRKPMNQRQRIFLKKRNCKMRRNE